MSSLPDVKIAQLRHFVAVVDHHGFKAAAQSLFRSQPAISLSVKELENLLGVPLFEKNTQDLTAFGKQFYDSAHDLLQHYNGLVREAVSHARLESGAVRIAVVPSVARAVLPRVLSYFTESHPKIEIWVEDGDANFVIERVNSGDVDFGCSATAVETPRLNFTKVVSDIMGVVCNIKHRFTKETEVHWDQLQGENIIVNGAMNLIDRKLLDPLQQASKLHISNTTSLLALIEANIGITILPQFAFPETMKHSRFVPLGSPVARRVIGTLQLKDVSLSPAAAAFHAILVRELASLATGSDGLV